MIDITLAVTEKTDWLYTMCVYSDGCLYCIQFQNKLKVMPTLH